MRWPLPALCAWAAAWALFIGLRQAGSPVWLAALLGAVLGLLAALWAAARGASRWRQLFIALGFPLSLVASGMASLGNGLPAWLWLVPLALLLALYPLRSWRDAPLFPTPQGALQGMAGATGLPPGARILDAGCGLGDGLFALRAEFPGAELTGLEWSPLLRWLCARRCAWRGTRATVRRADIWAADWSSYDMVYLFQRPESMPRAMEKAAAELRPGAWLASLEFEAVGWQAAVWLEGVEGKPVWLYRVSAGGPST